MVGAPHFVKPIEEELGFLFRIVPNKQHDVFVASPVYYHSPADHPRSSLAILALSHMLLLKTK
jgi:hypothetical protein